jgi:hypothetical protein
LREAGLGSSVSAITKALFSFNIGVELGELTIVAAFLAPPSGICAKAKPSNASDTPQKSLINANVELFRRDGGSSARPMV